MGFGPGGLDCDEVMEDIYLYLDDETDPAARAKMQAHLHDCEPCLRALGLEQDLKSLIARTCGGDVAPRELHERVRVRLTQVSIETAHVEFRAD
ncbi:MAG: mycothiol system anti-sigma-R factor [Actinomycetota bacterium]|nr:mycothiol system anti-sigma-R factor [Actinomycetota bacterium]